ncbi:MAG: biopolymer transporter ExbD [Bacteroidetes bacterium]|jgi:biopolymer transport protein ExbD|nr:biopolymer transporter ExbD [Bacteroidota bacterium]
MARRELGEINAGSMADIAFLLLIFFLVTTTMDTDSGISRTLPPPVPPEQQEDKEIKERNIFTVLVNRDDRLLVEGRVMNLDNLTQEAKMFISNPQNAGNLPEKEVQEIPFFGQYPVSKQVISLRNDRGTSYGMYIKVQNELTRAYNELRDELAIQKFGKKYEELEEAKKDAVKDIYPMRISEAEPKNVGG